MCGNIEEIPQIGWHFMYNANHYFYILSKQNSELHISMPHVANSSDYDINKLTDVINKTNLNVKFVKAILLESGSVSLDYYHKMNPKEQVANIIPHIIGALDFASNYFKKRLEGL